MKAFHDDLKIKEKYLNRVRAHAAADEIIQGKYWENGKGCAVGCTVHSSSHASYETELGIPRTLARLEDGIFEALPMDLAKTWPDRFLSAVNVGADLSQVWPKFAVWLLINKKYGVVQFVKSRPSRKTIFAVAKAYKLQLDGSIVSAEEWLTLRRAASAAADASAYAAAAAAYAASAYAAAAAAYADAAYAAYAAYAKRKEWRIAQSEKLLKLLKEAK